MSDSGTLDEQRQRAELSLLEAKLEVEKAQLRVWLAEADLREFAAEAVRTYNEVLKSSMPDLIGEDRLARKAAIADVDKARARCVQQRGANDQH